MAKNKIIYNGNTLIDLTSDTVTAGSMLSGTTAHDRSGAAVTGNIATKTSSDLTVSGATVTAPTGYYASAATKTVSSGTAGTPTATKGTVTNHSVDVTPSVTNTTGYIIGSTKTGTAVTVSASELVSGSETKTANGTYDVTNLAQLIVNVSGGGGSGITFESGTFTPTSDISRPTISFTNTHSKAPFLIYVADASNQTTLTATSSIVEFIYEDTYMVNGYGYKVGASGSTIRYGIARYSYISSSNNTSQSTALQYNSDDQGDSGSTYARYWAKETAFWPSCASASRYFKSGRSYKWFAFFLPTT